VSSVELPFVLRASHSIQTASVIKLSILYEALEQVRASKVHRDDKIVLKAAGRVKGMVIFRLLHCPSASTMS
jgi:beta-lactamase class A